MTIIKVCNRIKLLLLTKLGTMQRNAWEWEEIKQSVMDQVITNQILGVHNKEEVITVITMTLSEDTTCPLVLEVKMPQLDQIQKLGDQECQKDKNEEIEQMESHLLFLQDQ